MTRPYDLEPDRREDAPAGLFLSKYGTWFHDGDQLHHKRMAGLLHRSIARDDAGGLLVTTGRDRLPFVAECAPFVVRSVDGATIALSDDVHEELAPSTLFCMRDDGALFVSVKDSGFWALLSRNAQHALQDHIVDDDGYMVVIDDGRWPLRLVDDAFDPTAVP